MRRRVLRWAVLTIGVPVLVWAADAIGERLERNRQSSSAVTRALREPKRRRAAS